MKKNLFILFLLLLIVACGPKQVRLEGAGPSVRVYKSSEALVIPPTYYPDSTLGKIENDTQNIFIKIWIDPKAVEKIVFNTTKIEDILGSPNLTLPPGVSHNNMAVDFGFHLILAEGMVKTNFFGWRSLGLVKREFTVDSQMNGGYYGWQIRFSQGDFKR